MEDHVEIARGCGHEEEEEVVVGEGEQPVLVDRVQKVAAVHLFFCKHQVLVIFSVSLYSVTFGQVGSENPSFQR